MSDRQLRRPGRHLLALLAANVRGLRKSRGFSQEKLGEVCGLHRTYVGSVERGERNITLSSLEVLAQALGVTVPDLLAPRHKAK